jgi:hypothetical protein
MRRVLRGHRHQHSLDQLDAFVWIENLGIQHLIELIDRQPLAHGMEVIGRRHRRSLAL